VSGICIVLSPCAAHCASFWYPPGFQGNNHDCALWKTKKNGSMEITQALLPRSVFPRRLFPTIASHYGEILRDSAIEAVHICTPNAQHFPMAKDALSAGKHVLCEKPLATSVEEAKELVSLAKKLGLRNCVCHSLRYYPMVQQMRAM